MGMKTPSPPTINMPPPAAHPPTLADTSVLATEEKNKEAAEEGKGMDNTVMTSARGTAQPRTAQATLLG